MQAGIVNALTIDVEDYFQVSAFDGVATQLTEMDAMVAYLQVLGRLTEAAYSNTAAPEKAPDPTN